MTPREVAVLVLAGSGSFFVLIAAVSLVRFPDVYSRIHGASQSETLGAVLTFAAVTVAFGFDITTVKIALLLLFMFITNPTAAHAVARAAYDQGIEPWTDEEGES
ncbi:monovalent cation/H(+) antiporter subunit G [Haloarchaeobius salinus]|uniref:monovalent cation/H(+) antiporter subunit G n=1 Tax=Haloarchaeobius salinus TaxID=1198298 RepID=UPI00210DE428